MACAQNVSGVSIQNLLGNFRGCAAKRLFQIQPRFLHFLGQMGALIPVRHRSVPKHSTDRVQKRETAFGEGAADKKTAQVFIARLLVFSDPQ